MCHRLRHPGGGCYPNVLEGEDAAAYEELLARFRAAEKPDDIIDEMFIADVVALEWKVLRWRRLKGSLIRARGVKALEDFLYKQLDENDENYELYSEQFADRLAEILQHNLPSPGSWPEDTARAISQRCR